MTDPREPLEPADAADEAPEGSDEDGRGREAEVLAARRERLRRLEEAGIPPFALSLQAALGVPEPDPIAGIQASFADLQPGEMADERRTVAGRVVQRRDMGKLKFLVVRDRTGDLQLF